MSGSQHAESMEVEVFNAEGKKIASKSLTPDSPKWQVNFDKPGEYTFKAKAFNVKGVPSTNPCDGKTYINYPPTCQLSATPQEDYITKPFMFDATGSADSDGEVVRADFEITDETGNVVNTHSTNETFNWEMVFDDPGVYTVTVIVTDDFGAMSEPCRAEIKVKEKKFYVVGDADLPQARGSHGPYIGGRVGVSFMLPSNFSLVLEGGGAISLKSKPWKSFLTLDAVVSYHFNPVYVGAGLGFNTQVREDREQTDVFLLGKIGVNVFNNYTTIGSIFFEGQGPVGENRSFSKHHKLTLGFQLLF
jgi:PKD repeat protein